MRLILCGFAAGCWSVQQLTTLPAVGACAGGGAAALLLLVVVAATTAMPPWTRLALCVLLAVAVGIGWAGWRAQRRLAERLSPAQEGATLSVTGLVSGLSVDTGQGVRFPFLVDRGRHAGLPPRLLLTWRQPPPTLEPGQSFTVTVRLKRPHGLANPHGFDYEYWLMQRGIGATGSVLAASEAASVPLPLPVRVARARAVVRARMLGAMSADARLAGVLVALAIGDQSGIAPADWRIFTRTGIGHLISISGLHITMIAGLAGACAGALWRRSLGLGERLRRPLPLWCPTPRVAAAVALTAAFGYALLAGMEVPAQRTVAMVSVAALALWRHRTPPASLALAWAAAVALAIDPWAALSAGFWLSFGAVAAIFGVAAGSSLGSSGPQHEDAADPGVKKGRVWRHAWRRLVNHGAEAVRTQWAVTVGLLVPTALLFQQLPLVSPLANAIAIPLVSFAVTPAALVAALFAVLAAQGQAWSFLAAPASTLLGIAHRLLEWLVAWLGWLAAPDWAVWQPARPSGIAWMTGVVGTVILFAPWRFGWRWHLPGVLLLLPMLSSGRQPLPHGALRVTALDVGQGTAVLVETRSHQLLYDAGPVHGPVTAPISSAGERVVVPYLRAMGIGRLDALVISHEDSDHAGGARDVMASVPVGTMLASVPPGHPLLRAPAGIDAPPQRPCASGIDWEWDGVRFDVVHPLPSEAGNPAIASNTRSCVLRVTAGSAVVLLTGDIDRDAERALLRRQGPESLRADVLVVPHHGSRTSSTQAWLDAVRPRVALFQLGYRNRYRHPHPDVWARYGRLGSARYRSDDSGAVRIVAMDGRISVTPYRQSERRYWREAPVAPG